MRIYPTGTNAEDFDEGTLPDYSDSEYYRTNYTLPEVTAILNRIKDCVRRGSFIVLDADGREDNAEFLNVYGLYTKRAQASFLLTIEPSDFCHAIRASDGDET